MWRVDVRTSEVEVLDLELLAGHVLPVLCHLVERHRVVLVHLQRPLQVLAGGGVKVVHLLGVDGLLAA